MPFTRTRLHRRIAEARHAQACSIAVAVEILTSNAYALGKTGADLEAAMSHASHEHAVVDALLLELAACITPKRQP